jgi:hypothetical protein
VKFQNSSNNGVMHDPLFNGRGADDPELGIGYHKGTVAAPTAFKGGKFSLITARFLLAFRQKLMTRGFPGFPVSR